MEPPGFWRAEPGLAAIMNPGEMAALLGITEAMLNDLTRQKIVGKVRRGEYDPADVVPAYVAYLRANAAGPEAQVDAAGMAGIIGVTSRTIKNWAAEGRLPRASRGRWRLGEAVPRYIETLRKGAESAPTLSEEAARLRRIQADKAQREEDEAMGTLITRTKVEASILEAWAVIDQMINGLPSRIARDTVQREQIKLECKRARREAASRLRDLADVSEQRRAETG